MSTKVTKPRSAGSKASINRWQRHVRRITQLLEACYVNKAITECEKLHASLAKAQRR